MKNFTSYLLILTFTLLSGCIGERLIKISNDYYTQGSNMICINHSRDVDKGSLSPMGNDIEIENITLIKKTPRKSCAVFNFANDTITATSIKNNTIEIKPYHKYGFFSEIRNKDGTPNKASGHGPDLCFTKDTKGNFILQLENFGDHSQFLKSLGCQ